MTPLSPLSAMVLHEPFLEQHKEEVRTTYRRALHAGVDSPVVVLADLADRHARRVIRSLGVSKKVVRRRVNGARERGEPAVMTLASPLETVRKSLSKLGPNTASELSVDIGSGLVVVIVAAGAVSASFQGKDVAQSRLP